MARRLRSQTRDSPSTSATPQLQVLPPITFTTSVSPPQTPVKIFALNTPLPHLTPSSLTLLRRKQRRLRATSTSLQADISSLPLQNALSATLILANEVAGTAVSIHPSGVILTCSHCFGESSREWQQNRKQWLLFWTGEAVLVECVAWDARRDLALARVIGVEVDMSRRSADVVPVFASIPLAPTVPASNTPIICIGQPGAEDLESATSKKTKYNLIEVSEGKLRGRAKGIVDEQDCSEIGSLCHDAWTYWGHSGAPLVRVRDGCLVGVHSSWDENTGMRRGVPWVAIKDFCEEWLGKLLRGDSEARSDPMVIDLT